MKEKYVAPEMEVVEFDAEDIITSSLPYDEFLEQSLLYGE